MSWKPLRRRRRSPAGRLAVPLVLALVLPLGITACGSQQPETSQPINLAVSWWGGPQREKLTREALDLYTKRHPNVTFTMSSQSNSGYYGALETALAGGSGPDLFQIDDNSLTEYADRGIALDLTPYSGEGRTIDTTKISQSLLNYGMVNARPYAVAMAENTPGMVYDKTVLRKYGLPEPQIGWSYQDLFAWAAKITKASGGKIAGTVSASANYKALWLWLRTQDKELYANGRLGFDAADLQRWFQLWSDARTAGANPGRTLGSATGGITKQPVVLKQAATGFVWSNQLAEMQNATDHELGITAYPGDPRGQWARAALYWSVYKGSDHAAAAADVIDFLVNDLEAGKLLGTERGLPANTDVRVAVASSLDTATRQTLELQTALTPKFGPAPAPPPKEHSQINTLLNDASDGVIYDGDAPERAAARFVLQAREILSD